jgi:hypothetical protein
VGVGLNCEVNKTVLITEVIGTKKTHYEITVICIAHRKVLTFVSLVIEVLPS